MLRDIRRTSSHFERKLRVPYAGNLHKSLLYNGLRASWSMAYNLLFVT